MRNGKAAGALALSATEAETVTRAVQRAPSVRDGQTWRVEIRQEGAELYERFEVPLPRRDRAGRARITSCGTALTDLELAVRILGWRTEVVPLPDPWRPELIARVRITGRGPVHEADVARYSAIFRRGSHQARFGARPVLAAELDAVTTAAAVPGTQTWQVDGWREPEILADLLTYAAGALRAEPTSRAELIARAGLFGDPLPRPSRLPWGTPAQPDTPTPRAMALAHRLRGEAVLLVLTDRDDRRAQLQAGRAVQQAWLTGVAQGMVGAMLTRPLELPAVRRRLIERLALPGIPQVMLRLGYPVTPEAPGPRPATGQTRAGRVDARAH